MNAQAAVSTVARAVLVIHNATRIAALLGQAAEAAGTARVFTELGNEVSAAECARLAEDLRGEAETIREAIA